MKNDETRSDILEKARRLFLLNGFSKVTTGDIAGSIGVSKKTLYKYFETKEALLEASIFQMIQDTCERIEKAVNDGSITFPQKLVSVRRIVLETVTSFKPGFLNDIRKNARSLWQKIEVIRREKLSVNLTALVIMGKSQGYIRSEFNEKIFLVLFLNLIDGTINPDSLSESSYSAAELLEGIFALMFAGALTDKGRKKLQIGRKMEDAK